MTIYGGETTVTVRGDGRGGRCQEIALAAALDIQGVAGIGILAAGTDGTDGPTDAAGALVDGGSIARGQAAGLDARAMLEDNDSYGFLKVSGDLLITGPTGTNVNDLMIAFSEGPAR
jgi:glycerate-2-kinase